MQSARICAARFLYKEDQAFKKVFKLSGFQVKSKEKIGLRYFKICPTFFKKQGTNFLPHQTLLKIKTLQLSFFVRISPLSGDSILTHIGR